MSIFILRQCHWNHVSTVVCRQHVVSCIGCECWDRGNELLNQLRCTRLALQAICGEDKLMVSNIQHFHVCEYDVLSSTLYER